MDSRPSNPPQLREISDQRSSRAPAAPRSDAPAAAAADVDVDAARDPRAVRIVAKTIYRELRHSGMGHEQVMAVAGELLSLVVDEVRARRADTPKP